MLPRFRRKSPWTVCSVESTVKFTLVCAGSSVKVFCCACASSAGSSPHRISNEMRRNSRTFNSIYLPQLLLMQLHAARYSQNLLRCQQLPAQVEQPGSAKIPEPEFAHVDRQHPPKNLRLPRKRAQTAVAQPA